MLRDMDEACQIQRAEHLGMTYMWGIDSLRSATRDIANSQNWNMMNETSSRFVLSSLVSVRVKL